MEKCRFGCGKDGVYYFSSSKKWGCDKNFNACPAKRADNSAKKKGINPWVGKEHPKGMRGKPAWNKGLTIDQLTEQQQSSLREASKKGGLRASALLRSDPEAYAERIKRLSDQAKRNGLGGITQGGGRGKKGWYKGFWCDSSWELVFVIYHLDHNVDIKRNRQGYSYTFNGVSKRFYPDFLVNGKLVEIKGYITEQVRCKISRCPEDILLVDRDGMEPYLAYVIETYGNNFLDLYE